VTLDVPEKPAAEVSLALGPIYAASTPVVDWGPMWTEGWTVGVDVALRGKHLRPWGGVELSNLFTCASEHCFARIAGLTAGLDWWHGRAGGGLLIGYMAATWFEVGGRGWWEPIVLLDDVLRVGVGVELRVLVNKVPDYVGSLEFRLTVDPGAPARAKARKLGTGVAAADAPL
jgi:hypothetical protein